MYKNTKVPQTGLKLLLVGAAAILLLGCLWMRLGWRTKPVTLTDLEGDAAALEGFTVSGGTVDGRDVQYFTLRNGRVENSYDFDAPTDEVYYGVGRRAYGKWCVAPQERAGLEASAEVTEPAKDTRAYNALATDFQYMVTLCLPDNTYLRVKAAEVQVEEPVEVVAYVYPENVQDYQQTYAANEEPFGTSGSDYAAYSPFQLDGDWGICWKRATPGRVPGLYRVAYSLGGAEFAALKPDAVLGGRAYLSDTVEYGSMELFYSPEDVAEAVCAVNVAGDDALLLYQNTQGLLCVDLVDEQGRRTDHRELERADGLAYVSLMARQNDRDAVLYGSRESASGSGEYVQVVIALRAENARLTVCDYRELPFDLDGSVGGVRTILLNESGTSLMLLRELYEDYAGIGYNASGTYSRGQLVEILGLSSGTTVYRGLLDTGDSRRWSGDAQTLVSRPSGTGFLTIPQDRGEYE